MRLSIHRSEQTQSKASFVSKLILKLRKNQFLFEELVKRDFKQKYKRTVLGMAWSVLSPLLQLLVMATVFSKLFGRTTHHFIVYVFCGNIVFSYFRESTNGGMNALMSNSRIFTKVNVPKYLFVLSKNVSSLINFGLTLIILFLFVAFDSLPFKWSFFTLIYPIGCLVIFNIGIGMILSALFVFFRDISYLYDVFTLMLMYLSAIFYDVSSFSAAEQRLFLLNPVYCYIKFFRIVIIEGNVPAIQFFALCLGYALAAVIVGALIYKKKNHKFLYYV